MAALKNEGLVYGIIGGDGLIGAWLRSILAKNNHDVIFSDINTELTNADIAKKSDIIFIAVPLKDTCKVITEIKSSLRADQLLIDCASAKTKIIPHLLATPCEVFSIHPMFAPYNYDVQGQKLIVSEVRVETRHKCIIDMFIREGLQVTYTTIEEHDRIMGIIQGVTHFSSIAMINTLFEEGIALERTLDFSSPIYRTRLSVATRILSQDSSLYHSIFNDNPHCFEVIEKFIEVSKALSDTIKQEAEFKKLFIELKEYVRANKDNLKEL